MKSYEANTLQNIEDLNISLDALRECFINLIENPTVSNYDKVQHCLEFIKQEAEELITEYVDSGYGKE